MLAEAIITSTIVLTTLVGLYANFMRIYKVYKVRETYYDIDGVYAIKNMIDGLIEEKKLISIQEESENSSKVLIGDTCDESITVCNLIKESYNVKRMYIVRFDKEAIKSLSNLGINKTFKDYLQFILKYYNFDEEDDNYSYLFVVEYKKEESNSEYYYSSLGLR